ncbi:MAG TPA: caspase family protein [Terriglobales bacterium]|nr:caspase family protein [Terriglobales bacterium]
MRFRACFVASLSLVYAGLPMMAQAQSVGDQINNTVNNNISGTVSNAVSNSITESVVYSQARLQVTVPLLRFQQSVIDSGGNHLALRADDGSIRVWNLQRGNQGRPITGIPGGAVFTPSADGSLLIVATGAGQIDLRDSQSGQSMARFTSPVGAVGVMATTLDGQALLVDHQNGSVDLLSLPSGSKIWSVSAGKAAVAAVSIDQKNGRAVLGLQDGTLTALDIKSGKATALGTIGEPVLLVKAAADGLAAAAVGASGAVSLLSAGGKPRPAAKLPVSGALLAIGPSLGRAAIASGKQISIVNLASGQNDAQFDAETDKLIGVQYDDMTQRLIGATSDGKLLVWDTATRKLMLQIYITPTGWALVDKQGRFDGTADGLQAVNWSVNKLNFPISTLQQAFADPGLLAAALKKSARAPRAVPKSLEEGLPVPPKVEIEAVPGDKAVGKPYQLIVVAEDQGGGIKDVRLYHNGKIVNVGAILEQKDASANGKHIRVVGYNVWPTAGSNTFQAVATGALDNEGEKAELRDTFSGQPGGGVLNIVAVGVSKYGNLPAVDQLKVAASDAMAVSATIGTQAKPVFRSINNVQLTDGQATRANILKALQTLKGSKPEDAIMLFFSGHGFGNEDDWYFIPTDGTLDDPKTWVKASEIRAALEGAGAQRVFVVVDACYSGGTVDKFNAVTSFMTRFLENGLRGAGVQVLTATRRDQLAPESASLGYGFLTYVLLQGLKGDADKYPKDGVVTSQELARYAYDVLPQLFLQQRERAPRAFQQSYGDAVQEPAVYSLGADLALGTVH